ncbi:MAG: hypothetical protein WCL11_22095, partial [Verrucomicrobiota bacterium]
CPALLTTEKSWFENYAAVFFLFVFCFWFCSYGYYLAYKRGPFEKLTSYTPAGYTTVGHLKSHFGQGGSWRNLSFVKLAKHPASNALQVQSASIPELARRLGSRFFRHKLIAAFPPPVRPVAGIVRPCGAGNEALTVLLRRRLTFPLRPAIFRGGDYECGPGRNRRHGGLQTAPAIPRPK